MINFKKAFAYTEEGGDGLDSRPYGGSAVGKSSQRAEDGLRAWERTGASRGAEDLRLGRIHPSQACHCGDRAEHCGSLNGG